MANKEQVFAYLDTLPQEKVNALKAMPPEERNDFMRFVSSKLDEKGSSDA